MKVLWFTNTPANAVEYLMDGPVGGGWLKALDKSLQKRIELHVAFYYPKTNVPFKYLESKYYPIKPGNWIIRVLKGILFPFVIDRQDIQHYLKIIDLVKPDIVHIHGTENPFGCIIPFIDQPVVVSIQGCMTVYHHKFLDGFTKHELRIWSFKHFKSIRDIVRYKSFIRTFQEFRKMKKRERKTLGYTKYIIGRTDWDKRITSVLAPERIYFHGDEMLRETFYNLVWKVQKRKKLLVHTTNANNAHKGFETLCEALYELNSMSDLNIEWQVAGINVDDDIVKAARKKLKHRFPENGITYLGSINEDKLADMLCNADMYVSPSHIENSPNSLCEAMLIGIPCIATFAGGTSSLLTDKVDGILIQDGDPWSLAGAILELYRNPELAVNYGLKARNRALKRHDPERIVAELLNSYQHIIDDYKHI